MTASDIESDLNLIMAHAASIVYLGQLVATEFPCNMPLMANAIMTMAEEQQKNWDRIIEALYRLEKGDTAYDYYAAADSDKAKSVDVRNEKRSQQNNGSIEN